MPETPKRYFTSVEVEALIPQLTQIVGRLMDLHQQFVRVQSRIREEQQRIMMAGGGIVDRDAWRERTRRAEELTGEIREGMKTILGLGGVPKDLGMGLVDFPALVNDREVNLCWRFGETAIAFWHGLDEGYASRKPL